MPTTTRDRSDEVRALEELWAAPAVAEPRPRPEAPRRRRLPRVPGSLLAFGWAAYLFAVFAFQPAPEPGMTWAAWAVAASIAVYALLLAAPLLAGLGLGGGAFGAALFAGGLGMALAVNCRAAEHHLGNWWLAELGAAAVLTGLAAVGFGQRRRR